MPWTDLPLDELERYVPDLPAPADLESFWRTTLDDARAHELAPRFRPVDNGLVVIDTFEVTYAGFAGQPVSGWLHVPAGATGPLAAVVEYVGYGGGRGLAHERNLWAQAGYAHLVMDTRGQGSTWAVGVTPDPDPAGAPFHPGFMTRGILDPEQYYYRRVFTDGVRAVEAASAHELVDPDRIVVTSGSQGGAVALAVAGLTALAGPEVRAAMADVPFLSDFPRATAIADTDPYGEIVRYLKAHRDHVEAVFRTLSYFDVAVLGRWASAPALVSVALMDTICPPSTVFAAHHHYGGPGELRVYPYNDHEGGQGFHDVVKLRWLAELLG
ncbi:MAG: acetylxylan esterase [Actinomycetota bacterium]|nr:acetylxylan esterase [Actinomycetota bacterium]